MMQILNRNEMKNIIAGSGGCRLFFRDDNGNAIGYGPCAFGPDTAEGIYNNEVVSIGQEGQNVSGYCCSSCGTGEFSNADPC